jgi:hypothetical protein
MLFLLRKKVKKIKKPGRAIQNIFPLSQPLGAKNGQLLLFQQNGEFQPVPIAIQVSIPR